MSFAFMKNFVIRIGVNVYFKYVALTTIVARCSGFSHGQATFSVEPAAVTESLFLSSFL